MAKAYRVSTLGCFHILPLLIQIFSRSRASASETSQQRTFDNRQEFSRRYHISNDPDESGNRGIVEEESPPQVGFDTFHNCIAVEFTGVLFQRSNFGKLNPVPTFCSLMISFLQKLIPSIGYGCVLLHEFWFIRFLIGLVCFLFSIINIL